MDVPLTSHMRQRMQRFVPIQRLQWMRLIHRHHQLQDLLIGVWHPYPRNGMCRLILPLRMFHVVDGRRLH